MKKRTVRYARLGEQHPNAKLTDREVELIRTAHAGGMGYKRLAAKFEVSVALVRMIVSYARRWRG